MTKLKHWLKRLKSECAAEMRNTVSTQMENAQAGPSTQPSAPSSGMSMIANVLVYLYFNVFANHFMWLQWISNPGAFFPPQMTTYGSCWTWKWKRKEPIQMSPLTPLLKYKDTFLRWTHQDHRIHQSTGKHQDQVTVPCTNWQWNFFVHRHHQCPVKGCSQKQEKWFRNGAIASAQKC